MSEQSSRPPRDIIRAIAPNGEVGLVRAIYPGVQLRAEGEDDDTPTLFGHFAVFDKWTEIDSAWEGNFLERIAPGAFKKTFREGRERMRALFQHGHDPQIGDKPLGPIDELHEDQTGAYYEVPLLDTAYNRELLPGLEAGLYGASFRFRVLREEIVDQPEASDDNPRGLPERTVREAQVFEFGPVTFPAYQEATAGVRSDTDRYILEHLSREPERLRALLATTLPPESSAAETQNPAPPDSAEAKPHPVIGRRDSTTPIYGMPGYGRRKEQTLWRLP